MGEEDGQANIQVGVLSGSLQKDIFFNYHVLHLTAFGKLAIVFLLFYFQKFSKTVFFQPVETTYYQRTCTSYLTQATLLRSVSPLSIMISLNSMSHFL